MMTKLEKLIEERCPNGVEYKLLSEVAIYSKERISAKDVDENTYIGVDNLLPNKQGRTISTYVPNEGNLIKYNINDILIGNIRPYLKKIWFSDGIGGTNGDVLVIHITEEQLLPKFLYYILSSDLFFLYDMQNSKGAKMPRGNKEAVMKYKIPLPPLEVQAEIVKILDDYSTSVTALQQELEKELTARKKQYEYYRDMLFNTATDIKYITIDKISDNCDKQRKPVTSANRETGDIPYYGASGIVDYVKDYIFDGDYLLVSEDGANLLARSTPIAFSITGKTWVNNHAHILKFDNYFTRKYVEYYLNSIDLSYYITGGAQPKLNQKNLNRIEIPLPPLEEQERIVQILDRFDKLCNDISEGLPAEIEARQKQYEYYRDKLLTFKELTV